jgi:HK97 gp10 family phage protein
VTGNYKPNVNNLLRVAAPLVERVAGEVLADAVRICPQDTGHLARSLTKRDVSRGRTVAFTVGTDVHYAPFVEFGTYKMAAQPFLGPALNTARRKYG